MPLGLGFRVRLGFRVYARRHADMIRFESATTPEAFALGILRKNLQNLRIRAEICMSGTLHALHALGKRQFPKCWRILKRTLWKL